ncbi:hypothetical protein GCM10009608_15640 [Pseudonocardia alaniniphila]
MPSTIDVVEVRVEMQGAAASGVLGADVHVLAGDADVAGGVDGAVDVHRACMWSRCGAGGVLKFYRHVHDEGGAKGR